MPDNIKMLQTIATGLGDLKDIMVFVGGAVAELYATYPESSDIRPTLDIDCITELSSRTAHAELEQKLREKRFEHDISTGAPICRWIYQDIKVDVMPNDPNILGFTNRWYSEGIVNKTTRTLPDGSVIFILSPAYYLASKFEAHKDRGGTDLRQSHDFEDIIYIFENCFELLDHIKTASDTLKSYLKEECQNLTRE